MWILWKMWIWNCELCEKCDFENVNCVKDNVKVVKKWDFKNVNSVKNGISERWIFVKNEISERWICKNWDFQYVNFWIKCGLCPSVKYKYSYFQKWEHWYSHATIDNHGSYGNDAGCREEHLSDFSNGALQGQCKGHCSTKASKPKHVLIL